MDIAEKIKSILQNAIIKLTAYAKAVMAFTSESIAAVGAYLATRFSSQFNFINTRVILPLEQFFLTTKNKIVSYWLPVQQYCNNIAWVNQLSDASVSGGRKTTLLATSFVNILSLAFPLTLMQVYDRIIPNRSFDTMYLLFAGVIFALLFEMVLRMLRSYMNLWSDAKYEYKLSETVFEKLINTPLSEYEQFGAGERLHQISILDQMKGFYNNQLLTAVFDMPFIILFLLVIAYLGQWLVLAPLAVIVALVYSTFYFLDTWEKILKEKFIQEARENNLVIETINNIHTVKAMGMESLLMRRYERLQATGILANFRSSVHSADLATIKVVASQLVVMLIAAFGSLYVISGSMTLGGLAACTLLAGRIIQPLNRALGVLNRWQTVNIVRTQLKATWGLNNPEEITKPPFGKIHGEMELKEISFRYGPQSKLILDRISIKIPAGSVVGISGREQIGKTTLLNILATVMNPTSGQYLIDGRDTSQFQLNDLRHQIAYLSQTGDLFRGTIMQNLSAFDENYVPTAHRIAQLLGLNDIISKLPNGYDTMVGDRAVDILSLGVIRRIVITRALVRKPKIVLFDETNINLDMQSDMRLRNVLLSLAKISTIILVSHRPSLLKLTTISYELKEGKLIQVDYGK